MDVLYHFFPRKHSSKSESLGVLKSILDNGLFLTFENIPVIWEDKFGIGNKRSLSIKQYRFCLTAITNHDELIDHCNKFGNIGLEFDLDFIIKLGGFPVFYVPSPHVNSTDIREYIGISLLYRIGEMQEILEFIHRHKLFVSPDIDIENVLGAIRLLGNICYPTTGSSTKNSAVYNYYNEREWRIIHGLTPPEISVNPVQYADKTAYAIKSLDNIPIHKFIKKIVIREIDDIPEYALKKIDIQGILRGYDLKIEVKSINE